MSKKTHKHQDRNGGKTIAVAHTLLSILHTLTIFQRQLYHHAANWISHMTTYRLVQMMTHGVC